MIGVILNPRAGFVASHGVPYLRALIEEHLPGADVRLLTPDADVTALCRELIAGGATCIAAVGGDGTVSSIASNIVDTEVALGVVPGGTLNHFARDVGVGRDVPQALRVLAGEYVLPVDVATVNDRIFLNNSSIGLYVRMVEIRRNYEQRLGKWRAMAHATLLTLRHAHPVSVNFASDGTSRQARTYLLFVGNNQYELDLLHIGQRARLDAGALCCYVVEGPRRLEMIPHVFGYLRDHRSHHHAFQALTSHEITVTMRRRTVHVSCDGEVVHLRTPLVYRVRPKALRVVVPEPPPPGSREERSNL